MDKAQLKTKLSDLPVADLKWFAKIGSTNDEALAWAKDGAKDFSLVVADEQHQGRGRYNRRWVTRPGAALAFSLILRPAPLEKEQAALFSPLAALAVRQALLELDLRPEIKWPNDVLLNRRKVCGILTESQWTGDQLDAVVLGVGINISPEALPPDPDLLFAATSVESETGHPIDRFHLLHQVLNHLISWRNKFGDADFYQTWRNALAFRGEMVQIESKERAMLVGVLEDIDPQGSLLIRLADGTSSMVMVGDVRLRLSQQ